MGLFNIYFKLFVNRQNKYLLLQHTITANENLRLYTDLLRLPEQVPNHYFG